MAISAIPGSSLTSNVTSAKPIESTEATRSGGMDVKNDGDTDDAAQAATNAARPTTNNLGHLIGQNLSVTA